MGGSGCRSCCASCAAMLDPLSEEIAAHTAAGLAGVGMGELGTSPQQAQQEKDRINALAAGVDASMRTCYPVGSVQRAQWDATLGAWQAFYATPLGMFSGGFFGSGAVVDAAREFETRIVAFQRQAKADGCVSGPVVDPKDERNQASTDTLASAVKFAAVAAVAVAAVIAVKSVI